MGTNPERERLAEDRKRERNWKRWGPYLSNRQWGTVREDYSENGDAWRAFPFDEAHQRAFRWGEDGILGFCDRQCRLAFSLALWNGHDDRIKDRPFGLTGHEGNHAEDLKELYYYLDSTPTHSYCKGLYKYPQRSFPYDELRRVSAERGLQDPEYEILDTGVLDEDRYFDVQVEYAKGGPNDVLIRISVTNRAPEAAPLHVLPKIFFRNTWIWGCKHEGCTLKPRIEKIGPGQLELVQESLGRFYFAAANSTGIDEPTFLFCENETNTDALYGIKGYTAHTKDALHRWLIDGEDEALNPNQVGTIAATYEKVDLAPGETRSFRYRLSSDDEQPADPLGDGFEQTFAERIDECNTFYSSIIDSALDEDGQRIKRQAYAGLLWSKQFYHYSVEDWLEGDPDVAEPPEARRSGRNAGWTHLFNRDVISMPDKWEYPWYAAWDLAFHVIPFADIDPEFAKDQMILFLREWYMHPNGQLPAYEWNFSDVNPPVHAWGCWQVYLQTRDVGSEDLSFLTRSFHKLLLNFTWWVNRKDPEGRNIFSGGFLGLDNIGLFDRSKPLPGNRRLVQADATAWMAFYCSGMLAMALELARHDRDYSDVASKFFEHFVGIAEAINCLGGNGLWDEEDGFYYDQIQDPSNPSHSQRLKVRSIVGIIPLFAVDILETSDLEDLPGFRKRMDWYMQHREDLAAHISIMRHAESDTKYLLAMPTRERLQRILAYLFDEAEFLSPFGVRSLSRFHEDNPYRLALDGESYEVSYSPGESNTYLFGGNSNWRGPIWLPINYLIVQTLETYHRYYGQELKAEFPTGSGNWLNLKQCAEELSQRLVKLFRTDHSGNRPCHDGHPFYRKESEADLVLYHEFFHAETGQGLGASHQTGWTALVASLLRRTC